MPAAWTHLNRVEYLELLCNLLPHQSGLQPTTILVCSEHLIQAGERRRVHAGSELLDLVDCSMEHVREHLSKVTWAGSLIYTFSI